MLLKLAWRNIWKNRKRTLITAASIVFAVLLATVMSSVTEGVLYKLQDNVVSFYSGAIQVHKNGYWDDQSLDNSMLINDTLINQLNDHESIHGVIKRLESFALSASEEHTRGCMVVGIEPEAEPIVTKLDNKVSEGEYLTADDKQVLVAEGLAEYLGLGVGDTLVIIGQGYHGINAADKYPIKGLLHFASPDLNKRMVYLPIKLAQQLYGAPDRVTALVLAIDDVNEADKLETELSKIISDKYEIMGWKELMPELNQMLQNERGENVVFLMVLYILIAFGIFGTVLMMTLERQYEFGVLVAIGMRRFKLSIQIILENIFISLLGAAIGTLISIPVVVYFHLYPIEVGGSLQKIYEEWGFEPIYYFSVEPFIFYKQTLIVLIIALVISVYPLLKILELDPVTAMRT
ncbi:FtsX-like permease family protein [Mangrovivirga sp. M17]|uniref:FtsX-like permease family protein n=1 Tax=Mangrovivirga halotolerans TaxID=2993936 RepID=A0ABT3RV56_9BACT|nr:FtsX-like permease family protein [Mangrovivirga halotolerans]MCX2745467.1 FtsX-like permease family protein [Mangrovivirga halotolerans]